MKLQGDIFKSNIDGELTTFERAFPTIDSLDVAIDESGEGSEGLGLRCLTRRSVREYVNCSNPRCLGKGLDLGALLRQMTQNKQRALATELQCQSREESGMPCKNIFHIRLRITYVASNGS